MSERKRGFEVVRDEFRKQHEIFIDEKKVKHKFPKEIKLPRRADDGSSGYDFYLPKDTKFLPGQLTLVHTDVKAYMLKNEELLIFIRSSLAINNGLQLANCTGKIDSSYYNNVANDGNIILAIKNTSGTTVELKEGDRIAQGTFYKYEITDDDEPIHRERVGGVGSSDREVK